MKQRTKESIKMPAVDISVPMHLSSKIKQTNSSANEPTQPAVHELKGLPYLKAQPKPTEEQEEQDRAASSKQKQMFNFVIMSKKNNKPQYHNMKVPVSSSFANQFKAREEVLNLGSL